MEREHALDTHPVRGLADSERLPVATAAPAEHGALEDLDTLLVTLDDADVNAHGVARLEDGDSLAELLRLDAIDRIHEP